MTAPTVGWVVIDRNAISRLLHLTMVALGPLEPKTKEKMNFGRNRFQHRTIEILVHIPYNSNSENYGRKQLYLVKVFKPP